MPDTVGTALARALDALDVLREMATGADNQQVGRAEGGADRIAVADVLFADRVPGLLEGWLLGQAGGSAVADVLYGAVNPSGRLAETVPVRIEDTPAYLAFPGEHGHVRYGEGLFVGYRWYDARRLEVAFPFGHGLSYTTFSYADAAAAVNAAAALSSSPSSRCRTSAIARQVSSPIRSASSSGVDQRKPCSPSRTISRCPALSITTGTQPPAIASALRPASSQ